MKSHGDKRRILVVDDEAALGALLGQLLRSAGYEVETAGSATEALLRLHARSFDLVLTDNSMPGMSGAEMAAAIEGFWPASPVVMFSGNPPAQPPACVDLVLRKPNDLAVLVESLDRLLDARQETWSPSFRPASEVALNEPRQQEGL